MELLENQMKQYNWEQDQIAHMKVCIKAVMLVNSFVLPFLFACFVVYDVI